MNEPDIKTETSAMTTEQVIGIDNLRRQLPSVDTLLQQMPEQLKRWGHQQLAQAIRKELQSLRQTIEDIVPADSTTRLDSVTDKLSIQKIIASVEEYLLINNQTSLGPVINLSGTVLHTNLGRAVLPQQALDAVLTVAAAPSNLEFDLQSGERGDRDSHIEALVCELTGAEAATAVNNNAAAVLLVLNTLALNAEVPVSRGELVEIGGSFRIPEVMERSGCRLIEVGATNRTHLKDYQKAINETTALLLKVHTSNYRIEGFTQSVTESALAALAHEHGLPLVVDLGSGNLIDFKALGLPGEPIVRESIDAGVDIITFSGDKLLGGPQCGIIAGRKTLIDKIRSNPLKRALRLDKMTLAALAEVLRMYRNPDSLVELLPTLRQLTRTANGIDKQASRLLPQLQAAVGGSYQVVISDCFSQIGSGALPVETIPSRALVISVVNVGSAQAKGDRLIRQLADKLRALSVPVIGRISKGALLLDLRCLENEEQFTSQLAQLGEANEAEIKA